MVGLLGIIADMPLLEKAVKTAYSTPSQQSSHTPTHAKALVLSFVAFCSSADCREQMPYPIDGDRYALEAEYSLSAFEDQAHGIEHLQILLLLVSWPRPMLLYLLLLALRKSGVI
jgi:hypothetical protein